MNKETTLVNLVQIYRDAVATQFQFDSGVQMEQNGVGMKLQSNTFTYCLLDLLTQDLINGNNIKNVISHDNQTMTGYFLVDQDGRAEDNLRYSLLAAGANKEKVALEPIEVSEDSTALRPYLKFPASGQNLVEHATDIRKELLSKAYDPNDPLADVHNQTLKKDFLVDISAYLNEAVGPIENGSITLSMHKLVDLIIAANNVSNSNLFDEAYVSAMKTNLNRVVDASMKTMTAQGLDNNSLASRIVGDCYGGNLSQIYIDPAATHLLREMARIDNVVNMNLENDQDGIYLPTDKNVAQFEELSEISKVANGSNSAISLVVEEYVDEFKGNVAELSQSPKVAA